MDPIKNMRDFIAVEVDMHRQNDCKIQLSGTLMSAYLYDKWPRDGWTKGIVSQIREEGRSMRWKAIEGGHTGDLFEAFHQFYGIDNVHLQQTLAMPSSSRIDRKEVYEAMMKDAEGWVKKITDSPSWLHCIGSIAWRWTDKDQEFKCRKDYEWCLDEDDRSDDPNMKIDYHYFNDRFKIEPSGDWKKTFRFAADGAASTAIIEAYADDIAWLLSEKYKRFLVEFGTKEQGVKVGNDGCFHYDLGKH